LATSGREGTKNFELIVFLQLSKQLILSYSCEDISINEKRILFSTLNEFLVGLVPWAGYQRAIATPKRNY